MVSKWRGSQGGRWWKRCRIAGCTLLPFTKNSPIWSLKLEFIFKTPLKLQSSNGLRSKQIILLSFPPPQISNSHRTEEKLHGHHQRPFFSGIRFPEQKISAQQDTQFSNLRSRWQTLCQWRYVLCVNFVGRQNANLRRFLLSNVRNTLSHSIVLIGWSQYDNPCVHGL